MPDELQLDALSELMNISAGRAADMLNQMLGTPLMLRVPIVRALEPQAVAAAVDPDGTGEDLAFVRLPFEGMVQGTAVLVFPRPSALRLVTLLTGEEPTSYDFDSVRAGTLSEVGNIVVNGILGTIANLLHVVLAFDLPTYFEAPADQLFPRLERYVEIGSDHRVLLAQTHFSAEKDGEEIDGSFLVLFELLAFDTLLNAIHQAAEV